MKLTKKELEMIITALRLMWYDPDTIFDEKEFRDLSIKLETNAGLIKNENIHS